MYVVGGRTDRQGKFNRSPSKRFFENKRRIRPESESNICILPETTHNKYEARYKVLRARHIKILRDVKL